MEAVTGVFATRSGEAALQDLHRRGSLRQNHSADTRKRGSDRKRSTDRSSRFRGTAGMGNAVGALMGGSVGFIGGSALMALVPGVGPVTALGLLGAGILAAAGATIGATAGGKIERESYEGLPEDEIFVYEDALRKGRSVLIAVPDDERSVSLIREVFQRDGAESVDAARDQWWVGLRTAEQSRYAKPGRSFSEDEPFFRLGFQAAMHARTRCMEFDQVSAEMDAALEEVKRKYPGADVEEPFLQGYQRGREHYQELCDESHKAA